MKKLVPFWSIYKVHDIEKYNVTKTMYAYFMICVFVLRQFKLLSDTHLQSASRHKHKQQIWIHTIIMISTAAD